MKISELRELLKDPRVIEEINKHLWIESQKAGYSIGIERATDEWLKLYAEGWLKYNKPDRYKKLKSAKPAAKKQVSRKSSPGTKKRK
jgi:hypothetical protein